MLPMHSTSPAQFGWGLSDNLHFLTAYERLHHLYVPCSIVFKATYLFSNCMCGEAVYYECEFLRYEYIAYQLIHEKNCQYWIILRIILFEQFYLQRRIVLHCTFNFHCRTMIDAF